MKKVKLHLLVIVAMLSFVTSCLVDSDKAKAYDPEKRLSLDIEIIDAYLEEKDSTAEIHESGLRYAIHELGTGSIPASESYVSIAYDVRLLNNDSEVFDSRDSVRFNLMQANQGLQIGIPLIREGGSITLYVPSVYGFQNVFFGSIPPNSNLIYYVELLDVED